MTLRDIRTIMRMSESLPENVGTFMQVMNSFKERNNGKIINTSLFTEELNLKQITQAVAHADNIAGDRTLSKYLPCLANGVKGIKHMPCLFTQLQIWTCEQARIT